LKRKLLCLKIGSSSSTSSSSSSEKGELKSRPTSKSCRGRRDGGKRWISPEKYDGRPYHYILFLMSVKLVLNHWTNHDRVAPVKLSLSLKGEAAHIVDNALSMNVG